MAEDKLALSVPEAAKRLGIGRGLAYEAMQRRDVPSIRIGGRILVPVAPLDRMMQGAHGQPDPVGFGRV